MTMTEPTPTVPTLDLAPQDITNRVDKLFAYHTIYTIYSPLFQWREQRIPTCCQPGKNHTKATRTWAPSPGESISGLRSQGGSSRLSALQGAFALSPTIDGRVDCTLLQVR
jgi:hypothetical protein